MVPPLLFSIAFSVAFSVVFPALSLLGPDLLTTELTQLALRQTRGYGTKCSQALEHKTTTWMFISSKLQRRTNKWQRAKIKVFTLPLTRRKIGPRSNVLVLANYVE